MFKWYRAAEVCHVYLYDAYLYGRPVALGDGPEWELTFRRCRWWCRGWTLQELLAPEIIQFWDSEWNSFGSLIELVEQVSTITSIDVDILLHKRSYKDEPVARRFSWAAYRQTTRTEDVAYSLLGLLDVNMPILYGEGPGAFRRLQEEFMKSSVDLSILLWDHWQWNSDARTEALAEKPERFGYWMERGWTISHRSMSIPPFALTNVGLRVDLPCVPLCKLPESAKGFVILEKPQTSHLLVDMCTSMVSKFTGEKYSIYLILVPTADFEPTADGQSTSYQVAQSSVAEEMVQIDDRKCIKPRARLALLPSAEIVPTTRKQLYLKSTKQQAPDLLPRKIALRMELNVGARVTDDFPAGSWNHWTSILTPQPVFDHGKMASGRRSAVVRLDFSGFSCSLCFNWSTDGLQWGFLPHYSLQEAYKRALEYFKRFWSPFEEEATRCYDCVAVKGKVVTIEERATTSINSLVVKILTADECSDRQKRWARWPNRHAPYNLETKTLYFDRQLRNELAREMLAKIDIQSDAEEFAPYKADLRSDTSSADLIALYSHPIWCAIWGLTPICQRHDTPGLERTRTSSSALRTRISICDIVADLSTEHSGGIAAKGTESYIGWRGHGKKRPASQEVIDSDDVHSKRTKRTWDL